jgi:HPt (histidine-containing phosphotransfer) domain-containing protein
MFELTLANWPPIGRLLSEEISEGFMVLSVLHKLTIGFAMVGVINGIFMQETFKAVTLDDSIMVRQKQRQEAIHIRKMEGFFKLADTSRDGRISLDEFCNILDKREVRTWLASMDFDINDVTTVFSLLAGEDKRITEQELIDGVHRLRGSARSLDVQHLMTHVGVAPAYLGGATQRFETLIQNAVDNTMTARYSSNPGGRVQHRISFATSTAATSSTLPGLVDTMSSGADPVQSPQGAIAPGNLQSRSVTYPWESRPSTSVPMGPVSPLSEEGQDDELAEQVASVHFAI